MYEPVDAVPTARVVRRATADESGHSRGQRSACCDALVEDVGTERIACAACKREYVRVGITYVPV